jgi:hypothetical protein
MIVKQEAINVAFGGAASVPPPHSIGGALSTSSVTSTPSGRPPALDPNTPVVHAPALGAHDRTAPRSPGLATSPHVGVGKASHRPQPDTIDRVRHPGRIEEASSHLYCRHTKSSQPVWQYARARSGAHWGGNGSPHLSIVISGRLEHVASEDVARNRDELMCALHSCIENMGNFHAFKLKLVKVIEVSLELMELRYFINWSEINFNMNFVNNHVLGRANNNN